MPNETPSPLLGWRSLYLLVGAALALEIAAFSLLTWIYR
jgi:hypothetical protein